MLEIFLTLILLVTNGIEQALCVDNTLQDTRVVFIFLLCRKNKSALICPILLGVLGPDCYVEKSEGKYHTQRFRLLRVEVCMELEASLEVYGLGQKLQPRYEADRT